MNKKKKIILNFFLIIFFIVFNNKSFSKDLFEIEAKEVKYNNSKNLVIANGDAIASNEEGKKIKADQILYYKNKGLIKTTGNSEYISAFNNLQSNNFTYNINLKKLNATGNVIFTDQNNNKFFFDDLDFDEISQQGKGMNVRVKTEDGSYLQSKKGEFDKKKNIIKLSNGEFTTCINIKNKKNEFCPSWSLKSKEIIHDKNNKKVIHKNAFLKLKKLPVFYTPYISHPDPSVKRQSGFLPPLIKTLSNIGRTIQVPYFWAINKNKDITITPVFYFDEHSLIKTSYRQALKNGTFNVENGYSKGYKRLNKKGRTKGSRNYFFADLALRKNDIIFKNNEINFKLQRVSQDNFVRVNKINTRLFEENIRTLENSLKISSYETSKRIELKTGIFENLNINDSSKYTYYLPDGLYSINSNKIKNFNTNFNSYFQAKKFSKNQKQAKVRNILSLDSKDYILKNNGITNAFKTSIYNNNIYNENVTGLKKNANIDNYLTVALDSSLPLAKFSQNSYQILKPRTFLKYTNGQMQNANSNVKILNYSDIYSMNRTNNLDTPEVGASLGYGIDYSYNKTNSRTLTTLYKSSFGIGQVLRDKQEQNMPITSSLNNKSSDFSSYFKYEYFGKQNKISTANKEKVNFLNYFKQNKITVDYNFNFENSLEDLNKQSLGIYGTYKTLNSSLKFEQKKNHVGNDKNAIFSIKKLIADNYYFNLETKKNFINNNSEYHKISFNYENDCIQTSLALNRDFYSDKDVANSKTLIFGIIIKPFSNSFAPDLTSFVE